MTIKQLHAQLKRFASGSHDTDSDNQKTSNMGALRKADAYDKIVQGFEKEHRAAEMWRAYERARRRK